MAKLLVFLCIALFAITMVMGCRPPGAPCSADSDCCYNFMCNPWAGRCTGGPGMVPRAAGGWVAPPAAQ